MSARRSRAHLTGHQPLAKGLAEALEHPTDAFPEPLSAFALLEPMMLEAKATELVVPVPGAAVHRPRSARGHGASCGCGCQGGGRWLCAAACRRLSLSTAEAMECRADVMG